MCSDLDKEGVVPIYLNLVASTVSCPKLESKTNRLDRPVGDIV